ncbi:hypothetical protein [Streptomyces olivaceus]|uniref:hypothetical protein n=1 Tax=Streptomyces olivaceus TaxID=47716 RepID=UPI002ADE6813|nr:hypothetical protein [Streptomyces olivaceus]
MRLHTTTVRILSALAVLALAGCTTGSMPAHDPASSASAPTQQEGKHSPVPELLSSAALSKRLLDESDLGEGYTRKPQQPRPQDDVVVSGCPAPEKLGGDAAVGDSLAFPRRAKASFTYTGGSDSEVAEELYSDSAAKLSRGVSRIFDAMISCPTYQVFVGSTSIDMGTEEVASAASRRRAVEPAAHLFRRPAAQRCPADGDPNRQRAGGRFWLAGCCRRVLGEGR